MKRNNNKATKIKQLVNAIINELSCLNKDDSINEINEIKKALHSISPFKNEPVDCVLWVKNNTIKGNDYNPNVVAPPEMELLEVSIATDGYTQPIVSWKDKEGIEVVDGFHRHLVGINSIVVKERVGGYLPISLINKESEGKGNRIAATVRHNRARGKHKVDGMSEIVIELKNRNWTNKRICKQLGMEEDEILRLCQITGLADIFSDQEFSKSWDIDDSEPEYIPITEEFDIEEIDVRTVNTNDPERIFHTYKNWECYKAGLYKTTFDGHSSKECEIMYKDFLSDKKRFSKALKGVISEWKNSCEHYLSNTSMNRIAWLGQAAMCFETGVPATFRSGYNLLSEEQQNIANNIALRYLNIWLRKNNRKKVSLGVALSGKQMELY